MFGVGVVPCWGLHVGRVEGKIFHLGIWNDDDS